MSGCFGTSADDVRQENRLNQHLDGAGDEAVDSAVDEYGELLGSHKDYGLVFKDGYGNPYMEEDCDEDGKCFVLAGIQPAKTSVVKPDKILVKGGTWVNKWIKSRKVFKQVFKQDTFFIAEVH